MNLGAKTHLIDLLHDRQSCLASDFLADLIVRGMISTICLNYRRLRVFSVLSEGSGSRCNVCNMTKTPSSEISQVVCAAVAGHFLCDHVIAFRFCIYHYS